MRSELSGIKIKDISRKMFLISSDAGPLKYIGKIIPRIYSYIYIYIHFDFTMDFSIRLGYVVMYKPHVVVRYILQNKDTSSYISCRRQSLPLEPSQFSYLLK